MFYRLWTLEEALIEALRTGFSRDPSRFEVQRPMLEGERSAVCASHFAHSTPSGWRTRESLGSWPRLRRS